MMIRRVNLIWKRQRKKFNIIIIRLNLSSSCVLRFDFKHCLDIIIFNVHILYTPLKVPLTQRLKSLIAFIRPYPQTNHKNTTLDQVSETVLFGYDLAVDHMHLQMTACWPGHAQWVAMLVATLRKAFALP